MTEDQAQELANSRALAAKLIELNANNLEDAKKKEHSARSSAFGAGVFSILLPFLLYTILDYNVFDEKLGELIEEHKWMSFLTVGVFTACWKGMKYLAVTRHDPKRKKK